MVCFVVGINLGVVVDSNRIDDDSKVEDSVIGFSVIGMAVVLGSGFKVKILVVTFLHSGLVEPNVHSGFSTLLVVERIGSLVVDVKGKRVVGTFVAAGFSHRISYGKPGPHLIGTIT